MDNAALEVRVAILENGLHQEIEKREKSDKYRHNMAEDIQARYADIKGDIGGMKTGLLSHISDDRRMQESIESIDHRIRIVERLTWVAVGGVAVIGSGIYLFASKLIELLTK
jgi:archaellum component FlaC